MTENEQENKSRISRITVGRVHNLGNYENIRYEVTVDVGFNDNPAKILNHLETTLEDLQAESGVDSYELRRARAALEKPESELDEWDLKNLDGFKNKVAKHEEAIKRRAEAKEALNSLGGTAVYTDAKDSWSDED